VVKVLDLVARIVVVWESIWTNCIKVLSTWLGRRAMIVATIAVDKTNFILVDMMKNCAD